jgi:hypothetical protein
VIIEGIKMKVDGIGEYLDSRLIPSNHMPAASQFQLKNHITFKNGSEESYITYNSSKVKIWEDTKLIQKNLFR